MLETFLTILVLSASVLLFALVAHLFGFHANTNGFRKALVLVFLSLSFGAASNLINMLSNIWTLRPWEYYPICRLLGFTLANIGVIVMIFTIYKERCKEQ
jgi:hypothetical protein